MWTTWRGGSYYIEVFSERYNLKFVKMELEKSLPEKAETTFGQNSEEDEEEDGEASHTAEDQMLIKEIMEAIYAAEGATDEKEKSKEESSESENDDGDETLEASRETTPESGGSWEEISTSL